MNLVQGDDDSSSSSDSSDSEGGPDAVEDDDDSSSISKSKSKSVSKKQSVKSSSESSAPREVVRDDDSSSETADDVSKSLDDVVDDVSEEVRTGVVIVEEVKDEDDKDSLEGEVREQPSPAPIPSVQVAAASDSDSDSEGPEDEPEEVMEKPVELTPEPTPDPTVAPTPEPEPMAETAAPEPKPRVNGTNEIKRPQFRHSSSSLSDEEIPASSNSPTASPGVTSPLPTFTSPNHATLPAVTSPAPPVAASPNTQALEDRKKEFLAAAQSPTPPPGASSPLPTRANASNLTKIYTGALESNNNNNVNDSPKHEVERQKPSKDITQIYTAGIKTTNTPPSSPKPVPSRNRDITQLYTGSFDRGAPGVNNKAGSPCMAADKLNPQKHNMSTAVDRDAIRQAYDDVRSDTSDTQWAVFKFDEKNRLKAEGTGKDFKDFKGSFSNEDRGFGYIRINTGDEMSKRAKFVFVTWVGPSVSVMKKAKMSTDKALMKDIIQNMSVELQFENHSEFSQDFFKSQVDKAAGARYGTGERAL